MSMKSLITASILLISTQAFAARKGEPFKPLPAAKVTNKAKIELGKQLFFEPRLSRSGFISCNSCHNLATGGVDNLKGSIGHGWHVGTTNSPTVFNSVYNIAQFWDGRAKDLKEQAKGPIENPVEMASNHKLATQTIASIPGYVASFKKVYKGKVTIDRIADAIAEFEKTLVTPNSRFDKWLAGNDNAMSKYEKEGYELFKTKGCLACHSGPAIGGSMFQKLGLIKPYPVKGDNLGRFNVTKKEQDKYFYKVPTLRNIELTYPYLHDGSVATLEEMVAIMGEYQLGQKFTKDEISKIVAWLKTLTGEYQVVLPTLPPNGAKTPKPDTKKI